MTTISITNPWTRQPVDHDITGLSDDELAAYAGYMEDDLREALNARAYAEDWDAEQYLAAWVNEVGPDEAGRVILGS